MSKQEQDVTVQTKCLVVKPHQYNLFYCQNQNNTRISLERFLDLASREREQHLKELQAQMRSVMKTAEKILKRIQSKEYSADHGFYISHLGGLFSEWEALSGFGRVAMMQYECSFKSMIHQILNADSTRIKTLREWFHGMVSSDARFYLIHIGYTATFTNKFNKLLSATPMTPPAAGAAAPLTFSSSSSSRPPANGGAAAAGNSLPLSSSRNTA
jgi:hypothetical protein